ncbi:MAG: biotin--[acetyl-CoA-carboxylase] ligase [Prolixibacteraceae bacterium]|jgi:BirA family transcriptional regulator, biotin operon repressor / biotin---[acetyl-CoA-carboxylase] ligase|nr:biotin--[acetyl-CoA-carboxylase] ligase [Prolixibacteraceae bacterium]MBT6766587.1 biotin--[acetyl-CoA-carboxylase] ligase [Prolixibacteraceae bacterium]MBT6998320.1 biotin--[acetyl-CoA-carboxylase] ligase [Prolixibacteraceae bacterium]MBT7396434.1 biotin--[acetyl-CoA-carboxylase] ligase [Prolixibacteraceae bacterium]
MMKKFAKDSIVLNEVESTNNYANHLILSKAAEEGTVVLARYQKQGRGQQNNQWESEPGKNLLASIVLFPRFLQAGKQFLISKVISLALVDFLKNELEGVSIKWPNDLYVYDKKVAGILIENSVKGDFLYSVIVGIGLNLNQLKFNSDAPNPVSLKYYTGKDYSDEQVATVLTENIFKWYEKLELGKFDEIDNRYFSNLFRRNKWTWFKKDDQKFEARISGIGEFGQLLLEDRIGNINSYLFKEVEFVI